MKKIVGRLFVLSLLLSLLFVQGCSQKSVRAGSKSDAEIVLIYINLGLGYLKQGRIELALTKLEHAVKLQPLSPEANHYIAETYRQLDEIELADRYFKEAVKLDPENPMVLNNYGAFLCSQSRVEEAEHYFLTAVNLPRYKTPELAYENIALCAQKIGDTVKAEEYFRKSLALQTKLPKSLYQMALISLDKKDQLSARTFLERFHGVVAYSEASLRLGMKIEKMVGGDAQAVKRYQALLIEGFPNAQLEGVAQ